MSRTARISAGLVVVLFLYLIGASYNRAGELEGKLGRSQGQLEEKDRQIKARDTSLASAQGRLDEASQREGQYVFVITALTKQLRDARLVPVVTLQDVPSPSPGPPVATPGARPPSGPTGRPRATSSPSPRASASPSPQPGPPCVVRNPLPTGPRCLVPPGQERDADTLWRAVAYLLAARS